MRNVRRFVGWWLIAAVTLPGSALAVDADWFKTADEWIGRAVERQDLPGAVLLVGQGDQVVYRKAYGSRAVQPEKQLMTPDTIFDLASLSKTVGTATSVMILVDRGKLRLTDKAAQYLPAFAANGKADVTIEQLLLHTAGLTPDNPLADYRDGREKSLERIYALPLRRPPGAEFQYSDVGYIVLGEIVQVVSGRPLDQFARDEVFTPLGMKDTCYMPAEAARARCAPTEQRDGHWMLGEVHDPRAYLLGGVAGHAGVFSTADDLSRYCRMIFGGGSLDGTRILSEATVREMIRVRYVGDGTDGRGYGWDIDTDYSSPRGLFYPRGTSFGHTGFTGTSFWLDPTHNCYVILLANAVHPKDTGKPIVELRRQISTAAAAALIPEALPKGPASRPASFAARHERTGPPADVLCGLDVLKADDYRLLAGRKVALITNHTGRDREGNRTIDLLLKAPGVQVLKLFSPEHGLYGKVDEKVGHTTDAATGLKVYSLYGETYRPTSEMLEGIDTIVYDIQDIGARFYTYPATLGYAMEEAAKRKIRVVVLDRPNPITGVLVDGPNADRSRLGFTAYRPIPVVHGMTIGELARMYNGEGHIGCDLTVVEVKGWQRDMWWDATGLTWTNPSPNMRNLTQAVLYPAVGLLEATNVSVGRGTDQPFELFGAPWIDARKLAAALNAAELPGLRFVPIEFTPTSSVHAKKLCHGVYILVTDRNAVEPVRSGLTMAWALRKLFGDQFEIDKVVRLLANAEITAILKKTDDPAALPRLWSRTLRSFERTHAKYLIYQ